MGGPKLFINKSPQVSMATTHSVVGDIGRASSGIIVKLTTVKYHVGTLLVC